MAHRLMFQGCSSACYDGVEQDNWTELPLWQNNYFFLVIITDIMSGLCPKSVSVLNPEDHTVAHICLHKKPQDTFQTEGSKYRGKAMA